jgi:hypothetical protein
MKNSAMSPATGCAPDPAAGDEFALLQIIARNDEARGFIFSIPAVFQPGSLLSPLTVL